MTPHESRDLLRLIFAAWTTQRQRMNAEDVRAIDAAYAAGLADISHEIAKAAVGRLVMTSKWIPTVAEIRQAAGVIIHGNQATGAEAWGEVVQMIRSKGSHRTPGIDFQFADPITIRVVAALNWLELCQSENVIADRARFIDCYEQIADNERTNAQASPGATSPMLERGAAPRRSMSVTPDQKLIAPPEERSQLLRDVLREINDELGFIISHVTPVETK